MSDDVLKALSDRSPRGATLVVRGKSGLTLEHPTFELEDGKRKRHRFDADVVRVGAGPGNDFRLDDPTVSSVHLEIAATERGFRLRDLGSTNGTYHNGRRISVSKLQSGDTVGCGKTIMRLQVSR